MKRWFFYLTVVLLVLGVLDYYFLNTLIAPVGLDLIWKTNTKQNVATVPKGKQVPEEIRALRQRHQLRPLTEMENGTRARDAVNGIYGFAACDVQALNATRTSNPSLEIHKHLDGIVYYVGYASEDHIEKYLTRQKNFHILVSPESRGKASVLFDIPVDFVSKCALNSGTDGPLFDLFVTTIPELQSFWPASDVHSESRRA